MLFSFTKISYKRNACGGAETKYQFLLALIVIVSNLMYLVSWLIKREDGTHALICNNLYLAIPVIFERSSI